MELTAPFCFKDSKKRFVYGAVLVPQEADTDGDRITAEKIEEVAHEFAEKYQNVDVQHSLNVVGKMVESHIQRQDWAVSQGEDSFLIPQGAWMLGVKVEDEGTWEAVEKGVITGFSIMGMPRAALKEIIEKYEGAEKEKAISTAQKRTTLRDLEAYGGDWVVTFVSLVNEPAVPKAKFVVIKKADGFIPGSHEHIRWLLQVALTEKGMENERIDEMGWVDIHSVTDMEAIYAYSGDSQLFKTRYEYNESEKNVRLRGTESTVDVEARVVPDVQKSVFDVIVKAYEYFIKKNNEIEEVDMTKEETQALIQEFKEEHLSPILKKLEDIEGKLKVEEEPPGEAVKEAPEVIKEAPEEEDENEQIVNELDDLARRFDERNTRGLQFTKTAVSKSLKSIEEEEEPKREYDEGRDGMGRLIRKAS
jgi:hypothetical protein